jgi:hypothetical protein
MQQAVRDALIRMDGNVVRRLDEIQKDAGPGRMSRIRGSASGSEVGRVLENSLLTGNLGGH